MLACHFDQYEQKLQRACHNFGFILPDQNDLPVDPEDLLLRLARRHVSIRLKRDLGQAPIYLDGFRRIRNVSMMVALDDIADHPTIARF